MCAAQTYGPRLECKVCKTEVIAQSGKGIVGGELSSFSLLMLLSPIPWETNFMQPRDDLGDGGFTYRSMEVVSQCPIATKGLLNVEDWLGCDFVLNQVSRVTLHVMRIV